MDLHKTLENVIAWAKETGAMQLQYFRTNDLGAETKGRPGDVVTRVDKASETLLMERILTAFPDHGILGEESGSHHAERDWLWVVDPIDGTNNYSQGLPVFTISIGLQYKGVTQLGVVYAPYFNELYTAIRGEGAFLNGKPIHVSEKTDLAYAVLATGFPYDKDINPDNNSDNVCRILPHVRGIRRYGSAAYDLSSVAAGFFDGYWEFTLKPWDACAGVLLVEEAGGTTRSFRENRGIAIIAGNSTIINNIAEFIR